MMNFETIDSMSDIIVAEVNGLTIYVNSPGLIAGTDAKECVEIVGDKSRCEIEEIKFLKLLIAQSLKKNKSLIVDNEYSCSVIRAAVIVACHENLLLNSMIINNVPPELCADTVMSHFCLSYLCKH